MATRKKSTFERLQNGHLNRQQRKELQRKFDADSAELTVVHPHAAGIDIGSASHFVSIPADRDEMPVREFGSWTADLRRLAQWLQSFVLPLRPSVSFFTTGTPVPSICT